MVWILSNPIQNPHEPISKYMFILYKYIYKIFRFFKYKWYIHALVFIKYLDFLTILFFYWFINKSR